MLRNYLTIALRNLVRNKVSSFINIGGLAVGMAVAMLIGLWIWDELSYNTSYQNYDRIARVMQHMSFSGGKETWISMPSPIGNELRKSYGSDFKHVVMSSRTSEHIIAIGDKKTTQWGNFMEPEAPNLLTLHMLKGTRTGLTDINSVLLSETLAKTLFGEANPINKIVTIDNKSPVKVTGVYEDFLHNTSINYVSFIASWALYLSNNKWIEKNNWGSNSFEVFVQLAPNADFDKVSAKIKDIRVVNLKLANDQVGVGLKPALFLHPMSKWHLYSEFKNGVNVGGRIELVWLFGITGVFVLLLACINFMNLSTARSEKRAKEVGIRKTIGSLRSQLIGQFFCESLLVAVLALLLSVFLVQLMLPWFNEVADKKIAVLWTNPLFWLFGIGFSLITGLIAGSYPALYLSSFQPVKVLKGTFRVGRLATIPRKVLVVVQFTVSVTLIIGTIIVYRQIQFAKNRPVGYSSNGLLSLPMKTDDIHKHYDALRNDLLQTGTITEMAQSGSPLTGIWTTNSGFEWKGKAPNMPEEFATVGVTHEFGKTINWQLKEGRDFSRSLASDSSGYILNEAAVKFMGLENPVGETIKAWGQSYQVIGVIKDMVMQSPYAPVKQTIFYLDNNPGNFINIRIHPKISTREALSKIEAVFKKYDPNSPFDYKFIDDDYATKFAEEERIGKLASVFAILAIFISCLGLFGLASFMAEQRTKEIGVRKVLGASILDLWLLLSKDFVRLVLVSLLIATPISYLLMHNWLERYEYRSEIAIWIFVATGATALLITLLTVSYQSIKAALMNPVKSLRNE